MSKKLWEQKKQKNDALISSTLYERLDRASGKVHLSRRPEQAPGKLKNISKIRAKIPSPSPIYNSPTPPLLSRRTHLSLSPHSRHRSPAAAPLSPRPPQLSLADGSAGDWIKLKDRFSREYLEGVRQFLEVAKFHLNSAGKTRCPCKYCQNSMSESLDTVERHLISPGISPSYSQWVFHGEPTNLGRFHYPSSSINDASKRQCDLENNDDEMLGLVNDFQRAVIKTEENVDNKEYFGDEMPVKIEESDTSKKIDELMGEARKQLYPDCTKFSFLEERVKPIRKKKIVEHALGSRPGHIKGLGLDPRLASSRTDKFKSHSQHKKQLEEKMDLLLRQNEELASQLAMWESRWVEVERLMGQMQKKDTVTQEADEK